MARPLLRFTLPRFRCRASRHQQCDHVITPINAEYLYVLQTFELFFTFLFSEEKTPNAVWPSLPWKNRKDQKRRKATWRYAMRLNIILQQERSTSPSCLHPNRTNMESPLRACVVSVQWKISPSKTRIMVSEWRNSGDAKKKRLTNHSPILLRAVEYQCCPSMKWKPAMFEESVVQQVSFYIALYTILFSVVGTSLFFAHFL